MIVLARADRSGLLWCQQQVVNYHYLHAPVDPRCSVFAYVAHIDTDKLITEPIACLIFGRPESTRCYRGDLTYGSVEDVASGRAQYSRWEILNLARVWVDPRVQKDGKFYDPAFLPGYTDRRGVWRSTLTSTLIGMAIERIAIDYLMSFPPCFLDEPWMIRQLISYCDTRVHRGTIYRAAGFQCVRTNKQGIETWVHPLAELDTGQRTRIIRQSEQNLRSRQYRAQRAATATQLTFTEAS